MKKGQSEVGPTHLPEKCQAPPDTTRQQKPRQILI